VSGSLGKLAQDVNQDLLRSKAGRFSDHPAFGAGRRVLPSGTIGFEFELGLRAQNELGNGQCFAEVGLIDPDYEPSYEGEWLVRRL